jgi:hypothetical protein
MARAEPLWSTLEKLPSDQRTRALERIIPPEVVQSVLEQTGHADRHYPRLPAWFVVWLVIGTGLFAKDSFRQIFKHLQRFRKGATPGRSTFSEARKGLGLTPLRLLGSRVVRLLGTPKTPGAFYKGRRLMGLDGFVLDVADTPANDKAFGRPSNGHSEGAFPQVRVLALSELGSHVLYRWLVKPFCRGESSMTPYLLDFLEEDMLLLWDRNFFSFKHVQQVRQSGAHLLARIKSNLIFEPIEVLPDGSYLAKMYPTCYDRQKDRNGVLVRIIEYTLEDPSRAKPGEVQRLLTTLLDAKEHPAEELIVLYHQRWEEELAIDELKTHQRERPVLRSKTPLGVLQEIEGLMLAHYAVRAVMQEAAAEGGLDPRQLSFTATLKILRCRLPEVPQSKAGRKRWWQDILAEVTEELLPPRRDRINPRVIRRPQSKWPKKQPHHRQHPQPTKPFEEIIKIE